MHIFTLSFLTLALLALTTDAKEKKKKQPKLEPEPIVKPNTKPDPGPDPNLPPPFYDWEHRTTCLQQRINPADETVVQYMMIGYAWDETIVRTPDHRWNWNSTARAKELITLATEYDVKEKKDKFAFGSGLPDDRGFIQFTAEVRRRLKVFSNSRVVAETFVLPSIPSTLKSLPF